MMVVTENKEFDFFVASKIGSFKHIKYHTDVTKNDKKYIENLVDIKTLQKEDAITSMVWGNAEQTEILIGRKNQQIQIYNTLEGFTKTYTADFGNGDIIGLGKYKRRLIAGLSSGVVQVWSKKDNFLINTGAKLDKVRVFDVNSDIFATGGEENELKVWRIGETAPIFTAKNLPHDWLQLRKPVWVTDVAFLSEEVLAVCSRYGYVRLYDTRAQRRPVCNVEFEKMAATCITPGLEERKVFVGFGRGQIHQVDLRRGKLDKGYKGCVGAVTGIDLVKGEGQELLVSSSLDRWLRVHHVGTKELVYKQYLTSKLASVLVQTQTSTPMQKIIKEECDEEKEVKEEDMDDIFDTMETVSEKSRQKRIEAPKSETQESEASVEAKRSKPSTEGSTIEIDEDEAIKNLLRSTEKQKRRMEKKKKEKKAKSVFYNA